MVSPAAPIPGVTLDDLLARHHQAAQSFDPSQSLSLDALLDRTRHSLYAAIHRLEAEPMPSLDVVRTTHEALKAVQRAETLQRQVRGQRGDTDPLAALSDAELDEAITRALEAGARLMAPAAGSMRARDEEGNP